MNNKDRMIMEEYVRQKPDYMQLGEIVADKLQKLVSDAGILVMGIEHRVKSEKSLEGKLYRKGDYYQKLTELTDLLGARVICYFADDVGKMGKLVEQQFSIDWDNSSDKRTLLKADAFGYLSLHYICSLRPEQGYPEHLTRIRFEVQVRSTLQHAWAQLEHDLGYKTEFGVPETVLREFARLACLMEIADDEFIRAREHIRQYTEQTREKIINDHADDVRIDQVSLKEYMLRNKRMRAFLAELAGIEDSEITEVDSESYVRQLKWLGIETVGQLQKMLWQYREPALMLAKKTLGGSGLDILSSNAALRFLCQAKLLADGCTGQQAEEFIGLSVKNKERVPFLAKRLCEMYAQMQEEVQK